MPSDPDALRLPDDVTPDHYRITITPHLGEASFTGAAEIEVTVHESVDRIVANAAELDLWDATLVMGADPAEPTTALAIELDEATEQVTFRTPTTIEPGTATLRVSFRGVLNDKLRGFYRSTFDHGGDTHTLGVTQFESTDARRAFPCWDEPIHKATFGVTLVVDDDVLAISNGPEEAREVLGDGRVRVTFADTMKMSTYLVAFVVGRLETTDPVDVDGVPLRIVHRPGQAHLTAFALEIGAFALRFLADYYGSEYPGDKLDMVAVPDFAFGAMENLGCVIYRENLLLIDPDQATQAEMQAVADVVAHELAHMWFGDLVTMSWWNGIWLNEAFATFMEMKATDAFRPGWSRWMHFGRERSAALDTDALRTTRAIEYPVHSPDDADDMFDVLTYQKGSAVVRMLEQYLGEEQFRDGIRRYLRTHEFANTETSDLWDALEAQSGEPVRSMMDTWIFQGGHPLIGVQEADDGSVTLDQGMFRYDGSDDGTRWEVPVVLRDGAGESRISVGDEPVVAAAAGGSLATVNAGGYGVYRVRYDGPLGERVDDGFDRLAPLERYAALDDALALCIRGDRSAAELLGLVCRLIEIGEADLAVWQLAADAIALADRLVVDDARRMQWASWRARVLTPVWDDLGAEVAIGDDDRRRALRGLVLGLLGAADDADAIALARDVFARDSAGVDAGLATGALQVVATHADEAAFEQILERFRDGATPQSQLRHLYAAARVRDPALFGRYLDFLRTDEIRSQNLAFAYRAALVNNRHRRRAWRAVRDDWNRLDERLPFNGMHRLLEGITSTVDADLADEIDGFVDRHPIPHAEKSIAQHRERMRLSVAFADREGDRFLDSLT